MNTVFLIPTETESAECVTTEECVTHLHQLGTCLFDTPCGVSEGVWRTKYYSAQVQWQVVRVAPVNVCGCVIYGTLRDATFSLSFDSEEGECQADQIEQAVREAKAPVSILTPRSGLRPILDALDVWPWQSMQKTTVTSVGPSVGDLIKQTHTDGDLDDMENLAAAIKNASYRAKHENISYATCVRLCGPVDDERKRTATELIMKLIDKLDIADDF